MGILPGVGGLLDGSPIHLHSGDIGQHEPVTDHPAAVLFQVELLDRGHDRCLCVQARLAPACLQLGRTRVAPDLEVANAGEERAGILGREPGRDVEENCVLRVVRRFVILGNDVIDHFGVRDLGAIPAQGNRILRHSHLELRRHCGFLGKVQLGEGRGQLGQVRRSIVIRLGLRECRRWRAWGLPDPDACSGPEGRRRGVVDVGSGRGPEPAGGEEGSARRGTPPGSASLMTARMARARCAYALGSTAAICF